MSIYAYVGNDPLNFVDPLGLYGQERSDDQCGFSGGGVNDSDVRWSAGLQGGVKLGVKGILGGAVELKAPVIESSLITGNRYADVNPCGSKSKKGWLPL